MATLFNTRISDTYVGLIKTTDNAAISATLKELTDGSGNSTGLFVNNAGDFKVNSILEFGSLKDTGENIVITKFVDSADGITNNNNDTSIPTSKAVKDFVETHVTAQDLDFRGDDASVAGDVDLDSEAFIILGTASEIETTVTSAGGNTLQIGIPVNPALSGQVQIAGTIDFADDAKARFGTSQDLEIYHNSTLNNNIIQSLLNRQLSLRQDNFVVKNQAGNKLMISAVADGAANLYFNDTKRIETVSAGAKVTGDLEVTGSITGSGGSFLPLAGGTMTGDIDYSDNVKAVFGASNDLSIVHDTSNSKITNITGDLKIGVSGLLAIQNNGYDENIASFAKNGAVELYYDNSKKFETTTSGVTITGRLSGLTDPTQAQDAATKAYVDNLDAASDLDFSDGTTASSVDLNTETFAIIGTANEVETTASGQQLQIGLPSSISVNSASATALQTARDISLTGQATATISSFDGSSNVSGAVTLDNNSVTGKVLTGLASPTASNILASDSILQAFGKAQSQINTLAGGLRFMGTWNANTNTPTLASGGGEADSGTTTGTATNKLIQSGQNFTSTVTNGDKVINQASGATALVTNVDSNTQLTLDADIMVSGQEYTIDNSPFITQGHYFVVSVGGTQSLNGLSNWAVGDWVIAGAGNVWEKLDHTQVDGTGTAGNIAKFSSTNVIADSIMAESSSTITITGSLDTTQNVNSSGDINISKSSGALLNMNTNSAGNTSKILLHEGTTATPQNGASIRYDGSANTFKIGVGTNVDTTRLTIDRGTGLATFANDVTVTGNVILNSRLTFDYGGDHYLEAGTDSLSYKSSGGSSIMSLNASTTDSTFAGNVGIGGTGLYTTTRALNLPGKGISFKNDVSGSNNNWSYIYNTATSNSSNLVFATGAALTALTLAHSGDATFSNNLSAKKLTSQDGVLELDDNSSHNGIINSPASLRINIDSDDSSTGEKFVVGHNQDSINNNNELFVVQEDGLVEIKNGTAKELFINANTHNSSVQNTAKLKLGFAHSGSPQAIGHIVLQETANNSFDGNMIISVPTNNGSGGSATVDAVVIKNTKEVEFKGEISVKSAQDSSFDEGIGVIRSNSTQTGYINMVGGAMNINAPNAIPIKFRDGGNTNLTIAGDGKATFAGMVQGYSFGVQEVPNSSGTITRIFAPAGACYDDAGGSSVTGSLMLILPQTGVNCMMRGKIRVFTYVNNESFDVNFAGYYYSGNNWTRISAWIDSESTADANYTVRFGTRDSDGKGYIRVGELTSNWSYPKFELVDFMASHSNSTFDAWGDDWDALIVTSLTGYSDGLAIANAQVNNLQRTGNDLYYTKGQLLLGKTSGSYRLDMETVSGGNAFRTTRGTSSFRIFQANNGASFMGTENNADLNIQSNSVTRFTVCDSGNITVGNFDESGSPYSDYHAIEIGRQGNTITAAPWKSNLYLSVNATITAGSTQYTYRYANEKANKFDMEDGEFIFANAPLGTAGSNITWNERMKIQDDGNVAIGHQDYAAGGTLDVQMPRNGTTTYTYIGDRGNANGQTNPSLLPINKTSLVGYSVPYPAGLGGAGSRLTTCGFLQFESQAGWTGGQRTWAITSGYDTGGSQGGVSGNKLAIICGNAQNVEPQLGNNGDVGSGTVDGANTQVAAYWDNNRNTNLEKDLQMSGGGGIFGKNYSQTSTSGTTSIVDTGIVPEAGVYEINIIGNPNVGGSGAYRSVISGLLTIAVDYTVPQSVFVRIASTILAQQGGGSSNIQLTLTALMRTSGGSEASEISLSDQASAQIRIKVGNYAGTVGSDQQVRIIRKI